MKRFPFLVVFLLATPASAAAESGVAVLDAGRSCACNNDCGGGNVCVETSMGVPMCCPDAVDGCPAEPGPGIPCPDAGPRPDSGPAPAFDAGPPSGMSGEGCAVSDGGAPATAWLLGLIGGALALARRR